MPAPGLPQDGDRHLGSGQGPGLVRADNGGRPEGLDGGEPLDQGMAGGHPAHRDGQGHRQGGGHSLGYQGHHDAEGEHEAVNQPSRGAGGAQPEDEDGQRYRHRRHLFGHPVDVPLQRAGDVRDLGGHLVNLAELSVGSGGERDRGGGSLDHRGAHEDQVGGVHSRRAGRGCLRCAVHRGALAGEGDVVDGQVVRLDQASVAADIVARLKDEYVTPDDAASGNVGQGAFSPHSGRVRHQRLERLGGLLGRVLLKEPDRAVEHDHRQDGHRQLQAPGIAGRLDQIGRERDDRGAQQHEREQVGELLEHLPDKRGSLGGAQLVGSERSEPGCRHRRGQALRRAFERVEDLRRRPGGDAAGGGLAGGEVRFARAGSRRRGVRRHV